MKKFIFYFSLFALFQPNLWSQDFSKNYTQLQSSGILSKEVQTLYTESNKTVDNLETNEKSANNNLFIIDQLLLRGDVFFNDTISNYINNVADELLKNNKNLRNQLKF